jgi:hypothetical protein
VFYLHVHVSQVELTELSSRAWQGSLRVGLVAKLPKSLPDVITELGEGSWALVGSSLMQNGSTVKQNFNAERLHLKVYKHNFNLCHIIKYFMSINYSLSRLGLTWLCGMRLMVGCMLQWIVWTWAPCCLSQLR